MQETRKKPPHLFIKKIRSRLKGSLEWKEMLSRRYNWATEERLTQCHAGNSPLCWRRWHMEVKGQKRVSSQGQLPSGSFKLLIL